jgi:hypothetical protein
MKILSHRGYWHDPSEKNTELAFRRSFSLGFGTETDIRDSNGDLVISHDMPRGDEMRLDEFLALAASYCDSAPITLALNIKSDGLLDVLETALQRYPQLDPFVFDMSIPDSRAYLNSSLPVYMRMSEEEPVAAWLSKAEGVWLDAFSSVWYDAGVINDLLAKNKQICIVSPELHGRDAMDLWPLLEAFKHHHAVTLCTDIPEAAVDFFAGT